MVDLIHQILDIAKNIAHTFDTTVWPPLMALFKSIGTLFVKILELGIMAFKWLIALL